MTLMNRTVRLTMALLEYLRQDPEAKVPQTDENRRN